MSLVHGKPSTRDGAQTRLLPYMSNGSTKRLITSTHHRGVPSPRHVTEMSPFTSTRAIAHVRQRQAAAFIRGRRLARRRTPCKLLRAIAAAGDFTVMVLERCLDIVNSSDHMGGGDHMEKRHQCITWTRDTYTRIHAWTTRTYAPHGIETPMHHMDKRHLIHIAQRHRCITWTSDTSFT